MFTNVVTINETEKNYLKLIKNCVHKKNEIFIGKSKLYRTKIYVGLTSFALFKMFSLIAKTDKLFLKLFRRLLILFL